MATTAYFTWNSAGRPVEPARPVREIVDRLKAAYPRAAHTFGWYADDAHYQASRPLDHTPFSVDEWPVKVGPYVVFATDVMHRPDLGVNCHVLAPYWLAEARAGRFPSLKYLIWQGTNYDVRNGWRAAPASGHYDHTHLSFRTDYRFTGLGSWSITPKGNTVFYLHNPDTQGVAISDGIRYRSIPDGDALAKLQSAQPGATITFRTDAELRRFGGRPDTDGGIDADALADRIVTKLVGSWTGAEATEIKNAVKEALREGTE